MIEFAGGRYYLDKSTGYYKTNMKDEDREYLHRRIYSAEYGNIPHGWHVHHKDGDPSNNEIGNLVCMAMRDHVHGVHKAMVTGICEQCGTEYTRREVGRPGRFCSQKCGWTWRNPRRYQ